MGKQSPVATRRLFVAAYVGSLGGFIFGYDLGAISATSESLKTQFHLEPLQLGLTLSSALWGTVCGSILAGRAADKRVHRQVLAACALLYAFAAAAIAVPVQSRWLFILLLRFLCGVAIGGFTVVCPLLLAALAPAELRGRVVGCFQLQVGIGVIAAFSAGAALVHLVPASTAWLWMLPAGALPALALYATLRWGRRLALGESVPAASRGVPQRLFVRKNTRSLLIATSIAMFNQLSGVNILLLYMLEILSSAGISFRLSHTFTVLISCLGLLTTLAGVAFVDRVGRKPLLYAGSAGMALCLITLGFAIPHHWRPLAYLLVFVAYNAFFAFSQGTVVWVYMTEIFPAGVRGLGQGYGATVHWIANALLVSVFPVAQHASTTGVFYIFALMMGVQIVVIRCWYPETRGIALPLDSQHRAWQASSSLHCGEDRQA